MVFVNGTLNAAEQDSKKLVLYRIYADRYGSHIYNQMHMNT